MQHKGSLPGCSKRASWVEKKHRKSNPEANCLRSSQGLSSRAAPRQICQRTHLEALQQAVHCNSKMLLSWAQFLKEFSIYIHLYRVKISKCTSGEHFLSHFWPGFCAIITKGKNLESAILPNHVSFKTSNFQTLANLLFCCVKV